jgi:hypothetical protein
MKFFFPDARDVVDPSFNFETETRSESRITQRDDVYAHEIFSTPPYDGLLISKSVVEGRIGRSGKYNVAQCQRLLRLGAKEFFRLPSTLEVMGDCGAFSYIREPYPPFSVDEVLDFYDQCGVDYGLSVDHIIFGYQSELNHSLDGMDLDPSDWRKRQEITLQLASEFLRRHAARHCKFVPMGVAQGWNPSSYAVAVDKLQKLGYGFIALGGMVPMKTHEILECLVRIQEVLCPATKLHLLGVTRCEQVDRFSEFGITSFDSTSPLVKAFKDDKDNYFTLESTYSSVRVPQVEGNVRLRKLILAGRIGQSEAKRLERMCLDTLMLYDRARVSLDETLGALAAYERLYDAERDYASVYRKVLEARAWKQCSCEICKEIGIHVILFRGAERNRRRGFHNLFVFSQRLKRQIGKHRTANLADDSDISRLTNLGRSEKEMPYD